MKQMLLSVVALVLLISNYFSVWAVEPDPNILWQSEDPEGLGYSGFVIHPNGNIIANRKCEFFEHLCGIWINKNLIDCLLEEKSINKCVQMNNNILAFELNPRSKDEFVINYTSDLHDSGLNYIKQYSKSNVKFLAESENSEFKFYIDNNNQIIHEGQIFYQLEKSIYKQLYSVQDYFTLILHQGKYIDLISKDTIELIDTNFIINGKLKFNYKIGMDFLELNFDFIEFDFEQGRKFEDSTYSIDLKDSILEFRNILSSYEYGYIKGEKIIYRLLKID